MGSLAPQTARTFYNVADALVPPNGGPGAGDVDLLPALEARLGGEDARAAFARRLRLLEWEARLRRRRSFAWLSREERRALLAAWESSPFPRRRRAGRALRRLVEELFAEAQSRGGA